MRCTALVLGIFASASLSACSHDAPGTVEWSRTFDASLLDDARLAGDGSDRLGLAASYVGPLVYDGVVLHHKGKDQGTFLSVFDTDGHRLWLKQLTGTGFQDVGGLATGAQGHWLLAGDFDGAFTLGADTSLRALSLDMFLADFDPDGNLVWSKHFSSDMGGPSGEGSASPVAGLAITPGGDIVTGGRMTGTFGFGGPPLHPEIPAKSGGIPTTHGFVVELDSKGAHRWSVAMDGDRSIVSTLAIDPRGDTLIGGAYSGSVKLGELVLPGKTTDPFSHGFVGKLGPGGEPRWLVKLKGNEQAEPLGIAADPSGNVIVAGKCPSGPQSCAPFGVPMQCPSSLPSCASFVTALSSGGKLLWQRIFDADVSVEGMVIDESGHVLFTGWYSSAPDLGAGPLPSSSDSAPFLAELDGAGHLVKSEGFASIAPGGIGTAVALQGGKVVIAGMCKGQDGFCKPAPGAPATSQGRFLLTVQR